MATVPDRLLAMNHWEIAVSEDRTVYYDHCCNTKRFLNKEYVTKASESPRAARKKRKKRSKSSSSDESGSAVEVKTKKTGDSPCKQKSEFAAIHHERALNAGKLNKTDRGRRWRKKRFNTFCQNDKSLE